MMILGEGRSVLGHYQNGIAWLISINKIAGLSLQRNKLWSDLFMLLEIVFIDLENMCLKKKKLKKLKIAQTAYTY